MFSIALRFRQNLIAIYLENNPINLSLISFLHHQYIDHEKRELEYLMTSLVVLSSECT